MTVKSNKAQADKSPNSFWDNKAQRNYLTDRRKITSVSIEAGDYLRIPKILFTSFSKLIPTGSSLPPT
jgi:hypothetical protein